MSINLAAERLPWESDEPLVEVLEAPGFPAGHPAEPDLFVRQLGIPGHDQAALERARVVMVGAGGLGSWTGLGLVRSGVKNLTILDPDRFDRTNAHRQLMFAGDLGRYKASSLARNLLPHMIAGGVIAAMNMPFEEGGQQSDLPTDLLLVLVDDNRCRLSACRWARDRRIPAVFAMLSLDGMRLHAFWQGPGHSDACLWCALPNLDPLAGVPCANALIAAPMLAASHVMFLAHRAIMGWPGGEDGHNWREADLLNGSARHGLVTRRDDCLVCKIGN